MKNQLVLVVPLLSLFLHFAFAQNLIACNHTSEVIHSEVPQSFSSSNDLHKSSVSLFAAQGEKIYISGKVTDENCVPIVGALVFIWHPNSKGSYQFTKMTDVDKSLGELDKSGFHGNQPSDLEKLQSKVHTDVRNTTLPLSATDLQKSVIDHTKKLQNIQDDISVEEVQYDPYFVGTGVSVTNNMGSYNFITIMPGKETPTSERVVNFLVTHNSFAPLETVMYFSSESIKDKTLVAKNTTPNVYVFDIVLKGKNYYLRY